MTFSEILSSYKITVPEAVSVFFSFESAFYEIEPCLADAYYAIDFYGFDDKASSLLNLSIERAEKSIEFFELVSLLYKLYFFLPPELYIKLWGMNCDADFRYQEISSASYLALILGVRIHENEIISRNFSPEIAENAKKSVRGSVMRDLAKEGRVGIGFKMMMWASIFMRGRIVRIGRLQYEIGLKSYPEIEARIGKKCSFAYIHIPGGESLSDVEVEKSLAVARELLPRYYPEINKEDIVFVTNTWLLSPELPEFLHEESNIVKFQQRFVLERVTEAKTPFLEYVFGIFEPNFSNFASLTAENSLKRGIRERLISNKPLHVALGYISN